MKRNMKILSITACLCVFLLLASYVVSNKNFSKITTPEQKSLDAETIQIGKQIWTTANLNVNTFRNGDAIPEAKTKEEWEKAGEEGTPAWCYNDETEESVCGKLYNWYAVNDSRGLAPKGYHVPTDAEWTILIDYLGGEAAAGKKMKSRRGWDNGGNGSDESGFMGIPCGSRAALGTFYSVGLTGYWWSTTEYSTNDAWYVFLKANEDATSKNYILKRHGFSVRCIKD